ncbi:hypothetical protein ACM66B_000606 [Microbotryomycetes sp. NB124-2]
MDTYPSEFISHHAPLMFVAGLNNAVPQQSTTNGSPGGAPPTATVPGAVTGTETDQTQSTDPFVTLAANLRKTLVSRKSWIVWDNSRGVNNDFHVIPVDKNVRFPPLKARPSAPPAQLQQQGGQQLPINNNVALHSPISPLTPTSPLYPDGIMAPIWIRKHREMTPAVFVLVLRLGEVDYSSKLTRTSVNPLGDERQDGSASDVAGLDGTELDEERRLDAQLVNEIMERKRSTVERGIKLAVVLLCSRRLLDNPTLDNRLSLIRRQSGLDARASLFVISPVPQSEVVNFVASLKAELFPAALDFYREHGRRVRRKRARQVPKGGLSDKGWSIRYDYKMGFFSEMRSEVEVALKHYEDCYDSLIDMFAHVDLLPPRTKRWAEAKVLTDCLSVKVFKMYLYLNETARAVAQFNRHVARFRELSNSWGLGEQTFEFWSWLSKQYRLFGDLISTALRAGFRLPLVRPPASIPAPVSGQPTPALVPSNVLQHPGFYYFSAATAAVERRNRFKLVKKTIAGRRTENGHPAPVPASVMHESKVDHAELIIDLFTKAYEFFKHHKMKNMTVYVASQIAKAHVDSENRDMAIKFHDRISKNFRRDRWNAVLQSILGRSVELADQSDDDELAIRSLVELLSPDSTATVPERERYAQHLDALLAKDARSTTNVISIDMRDSAPLFDCKVGFWLSSASLGQPVPFQLSLSSRPESQSSNLVFDQVEMFLGEEQPGFVINHAADEGEATKDVDERTFKIDQNGKSTTATLRWSNGSSKVFSGFCVPRDEGSLTMDKVVMKANWNGRQVELVFKPLPATVWRTSRGRLQLHQSNPSVCEVSARKLDVRISVEQLGPAYIGERFPFSVSIENSDRHDAEVSVDLLLQPGEDDSPNVLHADDQSSPSFIRGVSFGVVAAGSTARKQFQLDCVGTAGERLLDISVRARPIAAVAVTNGNSHPSSLLPSAVEILQSTSIAAVQPVTCAFDVRTLKKRRPVKQLLDMQAPDGWEGSAQVSVVAKLHATGPDDIEVTGLRLVTERCPRIRSLRSSLDLLPSPLNLRWSRGDLFNALFQLEVAPGHDGSLSASLEVAWRRSGSDRAECRTTLWLPPLLNRPLEPSITLRLPPFVKLHTPVKLQYHFSNPTMDVLRLYISFDSAPAPGTFVFAGPRREPNFVLVPDEERDLSITVIPLALGHLALPRMRVFLQEQVAVASDGTGVANPEIQLQQQQQQQQQQQTKSTELFVNAEYDEDHHVQGAQQPTTTTIVPQSRTSLDVAARSNTSGGGQPPTLQGPTATAASSDAGSREFRVTVLP